MSLIYTFEIVTDTGSTDLGTTGVIQIQDDGPWGPDVHEIGTRERGTSCNVRGKEDGS